MIYKSKRRKTIRGKMISSNSIIIILAVVAIEISLSLISINTLVTDSLANNYQLAQTMNNSFDDMWQSFKWAINNITMQSEFQSILSGKERDNYKNGEDNVILRSLASDSVLLCDEMEKVYIYDKDGILKVTIDKKYRNSDQNDPFITINENWFDKSGKINSVLINGTLTFNRIIYDLSDLNKVGYIICVYARSALEDRVSTVVPSENRFVIVFDKNDDVVVHNCSNQTIFNAMLNNINFHQIGNTNTCEIPSVGKLLVSQYTSKITGWRTISVISESDVLRSSNNSIKIIALIGILFVTVCILVQWILARRITQPLDDIVKSIVDANIGDYSNKVSVNTGDEMEVLASTYNNLIKQTDTLVNQVLKGEIEYRNAQIQALQSQINPHLLFNTLECINWLAEYGRKDDIRQVTTSFSKIMKAMMSGPQMVTLGQELELVRDFLVIYKIFLMDKLEYVIDVPTDLLELPVPRLMIQPLVENAVVHGIKESINGGNINIIAASTVEGITISIIDDGAGMKEDCVKAVNDYFAGTASQEQKDMIGVGFKNVIDRIHLIYGSKAKLYLSSSPDWGTIIQLDITEEDEDVEENNCY